MKTKTIKKNPPKKTIEATVLLSAEIQQKIVTALNLNGFDFVFRPHTHTTQHRTTPHLTL